MAQHQSSDLQQTVTCLAAAYNFVRDLGRRGEPLLFVGTKKQAQEAVAEAAADGDHELDVAEAVLVADEVGVGGGQLLQVLRLQAADVAVIHDDADLDRLADLVDVCRDADIVVGAVGQAGLITARHVRPGAAVIDVGISRTEAGVVGDVAFDEVQAVAGAITPMPGGTGPMTIACLLVNTVKAAALRKGLPTPSGI